MSVDQGLKCVGPTTMAIMFSTDQLTKGTGLRMNAPAGAMTIAAKETQEVTAVNPAASSAFDILS